MAHNRCFGKEVKPRGQVLTGDAVVNICMVHGFEVDFLYGYYTGADTYSAFDDPDRYALFSESLHIVPAKLYKFDKRNRRVPVYFDDPTFGDKKRGHYNIALGTEVAHAMQDIDRCFLADLGLPMVLV